MASLRDFLGTSIEASDETLILLRMMGRPFGRPFNLDTGEEPDHVLRAFLRDENAPDASAPFLTLVGKLLDPFFPGAEADPGPLESLFSRLDDGDRATFAYELVKVMDNVGVAF